MIVGGNWSDQLRAVLRASRRVYTPLALLMLAWLAITHWADLARGLAGLRAKDLAAVFALIVSGHGFIALSSLGVFRAAGQDLVFAELLGVHVSRLPARYLPGGIWQTVARGADFSARGLPGGVILRVLMTEMVLSAALAALLGGLLLGVSGTVPAPLAALVFAGGAVGLALPPARWRALRTVPSVRWYGAGVLAFGGTWVCYGLAFWLFVRAVLGGGDPLPVLGVYYTAWLVGFVAVFAPQGVGVFEVTAGWLLGGSLAAGLVASMFGFRALTIMADLLLWALFQFLRGANRALRRVRGCKEKT